jgi:hypothetical protein
MPENWAKEFVAPMAMAAAVVPRAALTREGHSTGYTDPAVAVATSKHRYLTTGVYPAAR